MPGRMYLNCRALEASQTAGPGRLDAAPALCLLGAAAELENDGPVQRDDDAVVAASAAVRARLAGRTLNGLVNNAGMGHVRPLLVQTVANFRKQIEVNLVGMFAVTRAFAPLLGADLALAGPKGRIVNISSVGGKIGPPFLGAYAAAKHGVEGFSESLRRELQLVGTVAKPQARYAPVPGKLLNWTIPTVLPSRVVDRLIGGQLGLSRKPV